MKEFKRDGNNKVISSTRNIAQMNILEYIYYSFVHWNFLLDLKDFFIDCVKHLVQCIIMICQLLFLPITLLLRAYIRIKKAKKELVYNK